MKGKATLAVLSLLITVISCDRTRQSECISINEDGVPVLSFENITEMGELKFSDLAEDFEIIRLETNEECLIDNIMRYFVSDDYIIVSTTFRGIFLFSRDGRFLKIIAEHGNGPGEVNDPNRNIWFDEKIETLFVTNQFTSRGELICFNVNSGKNEKIPIQYDGSIRDIIVFQDSLLVISTMPIRGYESDCPVFCQTVSGEVLWKVKHINSNGATNGEIYFYNHKLFFNYIWGGDTLFTLEKEILFAHTIFNTEKNMYIPGQNENLGDILFGYNILNNKLISGSYSSIIGFTESQGRIRPEFGSSKQFIYNYKEGTAFLFDGIKDDILGSEKAFRPPQNNGLFTIYFLPQDIIALADKLKDDPDVPQEIKARVLNLSEEISINDNPILLVSKMK